MKNCGKRPMDYGDNDINKRTFRFAVKAVLIVRKLPSDNASLVIGRQLLRSGTSVGANIREAQLCSTRKNFIHKMQIALSEMDETIYWLELSKSTGLLSEKDIKSLISEALEIKRILIAIIKKLKN